MLNYEYPPLGGGGGVAHKHIAEELAKRNDVAVLTSLAKGLPKKETINGVDIYRAPVIGRSSKSTASIISMLSYYPASLRLGQKLISEIRPDIINSHFAIPTGPSAVRLAKRNRLPHALSIHGGDIYDPSKSLSPHRNPLLKRAVSWTLRNSDKVIAQSRNTRDNAIRIYGYKMEVPIIPLGLKEPALPDFDRRHLSLTEDDIVLVNVGRLVARKANHQLIEIVAKLQNRNIKLVIVGDGPQKEMLEQTAKDHGIQDQVILTGHVDEKTKFQFLQAADLFVSTTSHEGFGLMYIEAMFCKLPIITYDYGGQSDFLKDDHSACLIPLNDKCQFREKLDSLIQDNEKRRKMGDNSYDDSRSLTVKHCASSYEKLFEAMVKK